MVMMKNITHVLHTCYNDDYDKQYVIQLVFQFNFTTCNVVIKKTSSGCQVIFFGFDISLSLYAVA